MPAPQTPEAILRRLDLKVARRLEGLLQGDHKSAFRGQGLDLADLREYQYHDDVRHMDWNVTARMGRPFVKRRQNAAVVAEIGRTRGSVEFKYRNVSAVLGKLGSPWINGYRPALNAQFEALTAAINRYVSKSPGALEMDVPAPIVADLDLFRSH